MIISASSGDDYLDTHMCVWGEGDEIKKKIFIGSVKIGPFIYFSKEKLSEREEIKINSGML